MIFQKMAVFWVVALCSLLEVYQRFRGQPWLTNSYISNCFHAHSLLIALMMEAGRTSETLVNFYQTTWHYNPEVSHLHTHCRENLKSHLRSFSLLNFVTHKMYGLHTSILQNVIPMKLFSEFLLEMCLFSDF
jgi:hypothetical protein